MRINKLFLATVLLAGITVSKAQVVIPHSESEDVNHIMSKEYWKIWNPEVQAKIDQDIENNRKADALVYIPNIKEGTEVKIEQVSSDFYFGAHIFNFDQLGKTEYNDKYKNLYGTLFNSATVPFYWSQFEFEQGKPRFDDENDTEEFWNNCNNPYDQRHWRRPSTDKIVDYLQSRGVRMHGHCLIWAERQFGIPNWVWDVAVPDSEREAFERIRKDYNNTTVEDINANLPITAENMQKLIETRITEIAEHYYGRLDSWDVINETSLEMVYKAFIPGYKVCRSRRFGFIMPNDYVYKGFQIAQKVFPASAKLNINENITDKEDYVQDIYAEQVNQLLSRGCKVDIIGSQMHLFNPKQCTDIANGAEIETPDYIYKWSTNLYKCGLPIHLSEITISAPSDDEKGRMIQAIITRNLYRIWFSIDPMMCITWWNVVDGCGAKGEPSISGLFTRDMQPKPSYYALSELIEKEWRTNTTSRVDSHGYISFRGFKGKYKLSWKDKDGEHTKEIHVR